MDETPTFTAFAGDRLLAAGPLDRLLPELKEWFDRREPHLLLVFDDRTGRQVDFELRGSLEDVLLQARPKRQAGPGRPKLGVVSREVSLLPRHWEWLEEQPNGASAALRRLVDEARKRDPGKQRARLATEAAHRFMTAMAGNFPGFEEACRALFNGNQGRFESLISQWPVDVRTHLERLAAGAFAEGTGA